MKRAIIVGGGITGLSVAWKLSEKGHEVVVIESDKSVGGLAKSVKIENYFFDIGPLIKAKPIFFFIISKAILKQSLIYLVDLFVIFPKGFLKFNFTSIKLICLLFNLIFFI